jgi:predicted RNA-binding protein with PUA-like domain
MNYWLLKSEPSVFSIDNLKNSPKKTDHWDGVRNYQARNFMKEMQLGDLAFFYHSNCTPPGIVGIVKISKGYYPDHTALDKKSNYYDPKSTIESPRWGMVKVKFIKKFKTIISLPELKKNSSLKNFSLVKKGNRLSILPVKDSEWRIILNLI